MSKMNKKIQELMDDANWFWSDSIIGNQQENVLIQHLVDTTIVVQDCVKKSTAENIVDNLMELENLTGDKISRFLVLKNLMILLDVSAEILDRSVMFLNEKKISKLTVADKEFEFRKFGKGFKTQLSNNNIYKLCEKDDDFFHDVLQLILYASGSEELKNYNTFDSFKLGLLTGNEDVLETFILRRSIENSSQIKQLRAVAYGNGLQREVKNKLMEELSTLDVVIAPDNRYLGVQQFDIVLYKQPEGVSAELPTPQSMFQKKKLNKIEAAELTDKRAAMMMEWKWAIIEVSFQETTNSTMERKSKQAANGLYNSINDANHQLIYLIDGAGYFRRTKVIETLVNNSHQVQPLSPIGQQKIVEHLKLYFQ
ncbi:hypothetical protein ACQKDB_12310 [Planococcus kocurii]|uniref:hypothetical protein n=1 Tax=Planococcus kocurii TaxID=1374 RepID=UPI003D024671